MALYEHVFLARQDVSAQQVDALVEQYKGVIESFGGKVGRVHRVLPAQACAAFQSRLIFLARLHLWTSVGPS